MRKTVFLSSTGADLGAYRTQLIEDAAGFDGFRIDFMEEWGARSRPPLALCRDKVHGSDIFVGLIGNYRGWEPEDDAGQRSITEMEYDWALEFEKARLMFLSPAGFAGGVPASDGEQGERQRRFRARILDNKKQTVDLKSFGDEQKLSKAVIRAINNELVYRSAAEQAAAGNAKPDPFDLAARAGAAVVEEAGEMELSLEEMKARGIGPEEIGARFEARAREAEERGAQAFRESAQYWKRLGAVAFVYDTAKAMAAYGKAAALDSQDWEALWYLGRLQKRAGYLDAAKKSYESLLARKESIEDPSYIHWCYFLLGDVEAATGNRPTALDHYERGQALVQALAARDPNNAEWQRDLSVSYDRVGDISAARGDRDGALKAYKDGLEIAKALAARDPNNVEWQTDLVVSAWKLASAGAPDAARHIAEGLAILKRLHAEGRLTADQEGWIAIFEAASLRKPEEKTAEVKPDVHPRWKFWRK
jgi:tetratricopeptide (TPR) repeat protein